ncbi:MAG TPA: hypothetical protein VJ743_01905 [Albitalea sp.]|nr:hypothetical protein [Albitalea sp.]
MPNNAEIDRTGTTPSYYGSGRDTTLNHSCSGLADRQTERACREGISTDHANMPNSAGYDRGGPTEDQAD